MCTHAPCADSPARLRKNMALPGVSRSMVAPTPRVSPSSPSVRTRCRTQAAVLLYALNLAPLPSPESCLPTCMRHCARQQPPGQSAGSRRQACSLVGPCFCMSTSMQRL